MGVMLVGAVITVTLAVVTMYNTTYTLESRERLAALQSADAGIDLTLDMLEGLQFDELGTVCGNSFTVNNDDVQVTTTYTVDRSGTILEVPCPSPGDMTQMLRIESTATTSALIPDGEPVVRTAVANLMPIPPEQLLDKAIFSEASTTITNNSKLYESEDGENDAHVYSNGGVTCMTQVDTGGSIYAAQGDVDIQNTCEIGNSVWASGTIKLSSQSSIAGNAYAASSATWGIRLENSNSYIGGSALTNGGIFNAGRLSQGGGILRNAFARTGAITMDNQGSIGGSAYGRGDLYFQNGSSVGRDAVSTQGNIDGQNNGNTIGGYARAGGTINTDRVSVAGSVTPNSPSSFPGVPNPAEAFPASVGYPANIQAPPREQLPIITMTEADILMWQAAGYTHVERYSNKCSGNDPKDILTDDLDSEGGRLIIFEDCTGPVHFNSNDQLNIHSDVAMVSNTGFYTQNLHKVYSDDLSQRRDIHWIVPGDAPGVTWSAAASGQTTPSCTSPAGNIDVDKLKVWSINLLWYTPCTFNWSNGTDLGGGSEPFTGQIYAGKVNMPNATEIKMNQIPVPSLSDATADPTAIADMTLLSRFDLHG
ncbi:hypothetical protein [Demequina sp. SO4-18]|uniref:hypothetical protein n=1 Tax=Demequina sp. SO4-18 TaxID=3401026 RepID=UPI003B5C28EE